MLVGSFVNHLIHPMTYTAPNGELKYLTSGDKARVAAIVLSALTLTTIEALYSSRSLKMNFVSMGMIDVAVFYLATAAMKRKSRDSSSSQEANHPIGQGPKLSESGQKPDPSNTEEQVQEVMRTTEPSEALGQGLDPSRSSTSSEVSPQAVPILVGDDGASVPPSIDAQQLTSGSVVGEAGKPPVASSSAAEEIPGVNGQQSIHGAVQDQKVSQQEPPPSSVGRKTENQPVASSKVAEEIPGVNGQQKIPAAVQTQKTYEQLTLASGETQVISEMISMINDTWLPTLLLKQKELIQLGTQVEHIHSLKFLETILNNRDLKKAMREIEDSPVPAKWKGFLYGGITSSGFVDKCKREDDLGNIAPYLTDFCKAVKVDLKKVRPLYEARDWEELIRFLVKN